MPDAQLLQDKDEIIAVAVRYARALDLKDWTLLGSCFVPDAVAHYEGPPRVRGLRAIIETVSSAQANLDGSQHLVSNFEVEIDGREARMTSYLQAQHIRHRGYPFNRSSAGHRRARSNRTNGHFGAVTSTNVGYLPRAGPLRSRPCSAIMPQAGHCTSWPERTPTNSSAPARADG